MKYIWIALMALVVLPLNAQKKNITQKLKPVEVTGYNYGDTVEDFNLMNIDGEIVSMGSYENADGFIIIFSCNHCPYSVAYEDRIIELTKKYREQINPNDAEQYPEDSFDNMKVRAEEKKFNFPYLHDETQEVAHRFGATRTPHVFLIDKEMVLQYLGAIDDSARDPNGVEINFLDDAVDAMKRGVMANPYKTKAIGCSIKWKS